MAAMDVNSLNPTRKQLHVPAVDEIKEVLKAGLLANFAEAEVEIVDCPDLTEQPFTLAAPGLGGDPTILEIGGPAYLLPLVHRDRLYDVQPMLKHINYGDQALVVGAGAGPWPYLNSNCEMMMNIAVSPAGLKNETRISSVNTADGSCVLQTLTGNETRCAVLANLFVSQGKPGPVIKVRAKKRTGSNDFIASMQKAIGNRYKDQLVGLGGTFLMKDGKIKQHVMPDFSETPIDSEEKLNKWLHFYDMSTPLIAVGTFVSAVTDLKLRVQHFHSFSHHGEGGHYHIDTTPDTIEYLGYFNLCNTLYRIDQPPSTLHYGFD